MLSFKIGNKMKVDRYIKCPCCGQESYKEDEGWPYNANGTNRVTSEIYCCSDCETYTEVYKQSGEPVPEQYISFV